MTPAEVTRAEVTRAGDTSGGDTSRGLWYVCSDFSVTDPLLSGSHVLVCKTGAHPRDLSHRGRKVSHKGGHDSLEGSWAEGIRSWGHPHCASPARRAEACVHRTAHTSPQPFSTCRDEEAAELSGGRWVSNVRSVQRGYYSALKRDELSAMTDVEEP